VPFVFSSNGHLFVEYDRFSEQTSTAKAFAEFPAPAVLRARYEQGMGFNLSDATGMNCAARAWALFRMCSEPRLPQFTKKPMAPFMLATYASTSPPTRPWMLPAKMGPLAS
jgi:hypothetical protein